jgi:S-adenosylmethionine uptake transporter
MERSLTDIAVQNPISRTLTLLKEIPFIKWSLQKGYAQGAFWAIMICITSVFNDIIMRFMGERLPVPEIVFFRFLFSMLSVLPIIIYRGRKSLATKNPKMHFYRAIIGAAAIGLSCYSVNVLPLSENTTIMFAEPLFFLPMALILLREKVDKIRWIATLVGFVGLVIILKPGTETFNWFALAPISAAILFSLLNVLAKKMVDHENDITMLFYFGLGTTIVALIPAMIFFETPTFNEILFLALLGIGANLIQLCLFRAFSATDASALMPFRYVEFIFASLLGFMFFGEIPTNVILFGAALIIGSTFFLSYSETKKEKKKEIV